MNNVKNWVSGEVLAKEYLEKLGYKIVELNYKNELGEIDIIAIDPLDRQVNALKERFESGEIDEKIYNRFLKFCENTLVFVEVKTRENENFGSPFYAINRKKKIKISQVANAYIKHKNMAGVNYRFDAIGVTDGAVEHIENAFYDMLS